MRIAYIIVIISTLLASCSKQKLTTPIRKIETTANGKINDIYFLNEEKGFAIGGNRNDNGFILKTIDGGTTWTLLDSTNYFSKNNVKLQALNSIVFLNENLGQIVGHGGKLLRTEDGGKTWDIILNGTWEDFYDLQFFDSNATLLVSGSGLSNGILFKTNNDWYNLDPEELDYPARDLEFIDNEIGYMATNGFVKKTYNAGNTWEYLDINGDFFYHIDFPTATTGYVCGWEGSIHKTTDAGTTWEKQHNTNQAFSKRHHFEKIDFINESIGLVIGYKGELLYTDNGGGTWKQIITNTDLDFHSLYFVNNDKAFVGAENGTLFEINF